MADMKRIRSRVETDVKTSVSTVEQFLYLRFVSNLRDQPPGLKFLINSHLSILLQSDNSPAFQSETTLCQIHSIRTQKCLPYSTGKHTPLRIQVRDCRFHRIIQTESTVCTEGKYRRHAILIKKNSSPEI